MSTSQISIIVCSLVLCCCQLGLGQINEDSLTQIIDSETKWFDKASAAIVLSKHYLGRDLTQVKEYASIAHDLVPLDDSLKIETLDLMAKYHYFKSELDSALYYFQEAKDVAKNIKSDRKEASLGLSIASVFIREAQYESAIQTLISSTDYFESVDDDVSAAKGYLNMATGHANLQNYDQAITYTKKALHVFQSKGIDQLTGVALPNLATHYLELGDTTQAITIFLEAEEFAQAKNNKRSLGITYNNLGDLYLTHEQYDRAKLYIKKSIVVKQELGILKGIDNSYNNLGLVYANTGDHHSAIINYKLALETADLSNKVAIYNNLKDSYKSLGKTGEAFEYANKALLMKDTVTNAQNAETFAEISAKYETAKKENEILQLESDNQRLEITKNRNKSALFGALGLLVAGGLLAFLYFKNQHRKQLITKQKHELEQTKLIEELKKKELDSIDRMIKGQEEERNRISADLHDSLGSKMAALKLFVDELDDGLSDKKNVNQVREIADHAYKEVRNMSHLLNSGVLTKRGLIPAIKNAASFIADTKKIDVEVIDLDMPSRIDNAKEIQLFRIAQELLTNVIKHAEASEVTIQLSSSNEEVCLNVEDNGKGMKNVTYDMIKGVGLESIEKRVNDMGGVCDIDSVAGKGTSVLIKIPI